MAVTTRTMDKKNKSNAKSRHTKSTQTESESGSSKKRKSPDNDDDDDEEDFNINELESIRKDATADISKDVVEKNDSSPITINIHNHMPQQPENQKKRLPGFGVRVNKTVNPNLRFTRVQDDDRDSDSEYEAEYDEDEYDEDEDEYDEDEYDEDEDEDVEFDIDEEELGSRRLELKIGNTLGQWINRMADKEIKKITESENDLKQEDRILSNFVRKCSPADLEYFKKLSPDEREDFALTLKRLEGLNDESTPIKFKVLSQKFDDNIKAIAYKKLTNLASMSPHNGEYHKLKHWIDALCSIPFGRFKELPVKLSDGREKIIEFMKNTKDQFDKHIFGHVEAKDHITRIIAQWISNPNSKGNVIGIHGKPGVGKTTLIKDGLAKALDLPFAFVPLGGAHDASFLDGHGFTYEGSTWGKITELLIRSRYMNPVIYFDELDKISDTTRGQEIINVLIHLTDPSQNDNFCDKYFSEIPFDLSKALIVFTYNDDSAINPILKDRMIRIETKDYSVMDKVEITRRHIIPEIHSQFNIKENEIIFSDDIIKRIISDTEEEAGVRNLKRNIESIISNLNLNALIGEQDFPINIDEEVVDLYRKKSSNEKDAPPHGMYV